MSADQYNTQMLAMYESAMAVGVTVAVLLAVVLGMAFIKLVTQ
ncbi:MAG: hypothetical protein K0R62_8383 [Nonomuraea muscovyensis]|jgi:hypothetical protein|nr:hypothetical protein [Nonomuraea muscovyensis]